MTVNKCDWCYILNCLNFNYKYFLLASSWGKPQGKTLRNGFLHEALDEMTTPQQTTPQMKKNDMMQSSGK